MQMQRDPEDPNYSHGDCDRCGREVGRYRGQGADLHCDCGAIYNICGQRLRDDLYSHPNPSEYDDDIGDMEGYEMAMNRGGDW